MQILGRFGDTHVTPGALRPGSDGQLALPAGSVDVQFRVPVSMSMLLEAMSAAGRRAEVDRWAVGYRRLVAGLGRAVQEAGGYALRSPDVAVPARLDVATTVDEFVEGLGVRWHAHVWVASAAATVADGEYRPVAIEALTEGVWNVVWPTHMRQVEELAERELGVRWGEPRPAAVREIVEPPWHEHVGLAERGVCPGPWGLVGPRVLADDEELRVHASMERSHQVAVGNGTAYPPDVDPSEARAGVMRGLLNTGPSRAGGGGTR